jgi:hypothetical protein
MTPQVHELQHVKMIQMTAKLKTPMVHEKFFFSLKVWLPASTTLQVHMLQRTIKNLSIQTAGSHSQGVSLKVIVFSYILGLYSTRTTIS